MGARPSSFKKGGGGFLNNVDGTITGYEFTDVFPSENAKKSKKDFHSLYCILSVRLDGADEDVATTLFVGNADEWTISDDGHVLTPEEDGQEIGQSSGFGKFLSSLTEANFPEDRFPEDEFDWSAMIGTRVRFVQRKNENMNGKKRKAKNGKEYDYTDVVVDQVYDLPGKAGKKGATAEKPTKGKKAAAEEPDEDESPKSLATSFLLKVVKANKGKLAKAKISMQLLKPENGLFKHPEREAIRKLLTSDKFLSTEDGWTYDEEKEIVKVAVEPAEDEDDE